MPLPAHPRASYPRPPGPAGESLHLPRALQGQQHRGVPGQELEGALRVQILDGAAGRQGQGYWGVLLSELPFHEQFTER